MRLNQKIIGVILLCTVPLVWAAPAPVPAAKPVAKPAGKKVGLKKPGAESDPAAQDMALPGEGNNANNYGRVWKRSQLDLRVGLLGGFLLPIGQASSVLELGFGGTLWGSVETTFIKLPKSKIFENTLLIYEFSFYKVKGTSVLSKIGQDTDADYVTNAGAIGKAYDVQFSPRFVMRFIPYLGFGLTNITSETKTAYGATIRAISGDIIAKYGFATVYDFNRRWQAIMTIDHYIYFEEKIGMALRINLGATMMIF
ncbi:MAG: hypothetical protein KF713_10600 [Turneriella sp.]|nr:hypothetical protein [Turneriella sp.]